jgi:hypothetical protein
MNQCLMAVVMTIARSGAGMRRSPGMRGSHAVIANGSRTQSEEVLPLTDKYDHRDAGGETHDDRMRDELDHRAQACHSHGDEDQTGQERRNLQSSDAVLSGNAGEDGNEGPGGPGYLDARAAQHGSGKTRNDGCIQTLSRARSRCDGKRHRQRHRTDSNDYARNDIRHHAHAMYRRL